MLLPTGQQLLDALRTLPQADHASAWQTLLDVHSVYKLHYALQIVEALRSGTYLDSVLSARLLLLLLMPPVVLASCCLFLPLPPVDHLMR
jgi:hypothetical protein